MKRIHVSVLGKNSPAWESLLIQEGVPHSAVENIDPAQTSLAIVPSNPAGTLDKQFLNSLTSGTPGLCTGETLTRLRGERVQSQHIQYLLEGETRQFSGAGLVDIETTGVIPSGANALPSENGNPSSFVGEFKSAPLIALPFDVARVSMDVRAQTHSFYATRSRLPFEKVSAVSKGGVRMLLAKSLEHLHHRSGMPYAHLWYYPDAAPSIFCLRIDTDFAGRKEIENLYALARKHSIPFTWFVHVKAQEKFLNLFKEMAGHEIGVHCYEHRRYDNSVAIGPDIAKALQLLRATGLNPKGFAAPYGYSSKEVESAARASGFEYSSEFSRDYDNLPSISGGNEDSGLLQVPVHPISIGGLRRQGFSSDEMRAYFSDAIERKLASRQPLMFYHHPKDGHHEVLEHIFELIRNKNIPALTMGKYAEWWKARSFYRPEIRIDGEKMLVSSMPKLAGVKLRISRPDGQESFCTPAEEISLQDCDWQTPLASIPLPTDIRRIRKFNPWIPLIRLQDMLAEKKT